MAAKHDKDDEKPAKAEPLLEPCSRTIEELLADPAFDPDGHVRLRLAALSVESGGSQRPPLSLVTPDGMPVAEA